MGRAVSLQPVLALLVELRERGVELEIVGDRLRYHPVEAVTPELLERLKACKPDLLGFQRAIEAEAAELARMAEASDWDRPEVERCRVCHELDFVRPRVGGTWRCARCAPYRDLPGLAVEWWPKIGLRVPIEEIFVGGHVESIGSTPNGPCLCFTWTTWWRLKPAGLWVCSRCHPPIPPEAEIERFDAAGVSAAGPIPGLRREPHQENAPVANVGERATHQPQLRKDTAVPRVNLDKVQDPGPLPEGAYLCRIDSIEPGRSHNQDEMWKLKFSVEQGPYKGRVIHDQLTFSEAALPRVKRLCAAIKLNLTGDSDLTTDMVRGSRLFVSVGIETYEGQQRNKVRFNGFAPA